MLSLQQPSKNNILMTICFQHNLINLDISLTAASPFLNLYCKNRLIHFNTTRNCARERWTVFLVWFHLNLIFSSFEKCNSQQLFRNSCRNNTCYDVWLKKNIINWWKGKNLKTVNELQIIKKILCDQELQRLYKLY